MIKNCSREYKQKRISVSTHKYKDGGIMEKLLLDITIKIRNQKKEIKNTEVKDVVGTFVIKLRGLNIENRF